MCIGKGVKDGDQFTSRDRSAIQLLYLTHPHKIMYRPINDRFFLIIQIVCTKERQYQY